MGAFGSIGIVAAVTVAAGNLGNFVGPLLAGGVRRFQTDDEGAAALGLHRMKGRICGLEFRLLAGAVGRKVGAVAMALVAEFVLILQISDEISDPLPFQAAKGLVLLHHVRVMTVDTLGMAGGVDNFFGQGFTVAMNARDGQNRVIVGFAQFVGDIRHWAKTDVLEVTTLHHLVPVGTSPVTGQTAPLFPIDGHGHAAVAGLTGFGQQCLITMGTDKNTLRLSLSPS